MTTAKISTRLSHWLLTGTAAVLMSCGVGLSAPKANAYISVGVGIGVPGPCCGPYWGPRPYWYSEHWYHPYTYWGPGFNFYTGFPVAYVDTWPGPVRSYHRDAYSAALSGPIGQPFAWTDGYDTGSVTAVRDGHSGANYCREIRQDVTVGGRHQTAMTAACRFPDGSWRAVQDNP